MPASDVFVQLATMGPLIAAGEWTRLEDRFRSRCADVDGALADRIGGLELGAWSAELSRSSLLARPSRSDIAAVYWEFDPDAGWQSAFFGCGRYRPEADRDDDWAAEVVETTPCPGNPSLASLYDPAFDATALAIARNLYLFAHTFAALGRATLSDWPGHVPLCAGFHDQGPVFRLVDR